MRSPRTTVAQDLRVEVVMLDGDWSGLDDAEAVIGIAARGVANSLSTSFREGTIVVALSSDAHVAGLNTQFRGKDQPTNVLSFQSTDGDEGHIGDIVMASETVAREAEEQGITLKAHVQHLTVHGILHLLGYDHDTDAAAERMEALEIKILSDLGVANPYTGALETAKNG